MEKQAACRAFASDVSPGDRHRGFPLTARCPLVHSIFHLFGKYCDGDRRPEGKGRPKMVSSGGIQKPL